MDDDQEPKYQTTREQERAAEGFGKVEGKGFILCSAKRSASSIEPVSRGNDLIMIKVVSLASHFSLTGLAAEKRKYKEQWMRSASVGY